MRRCFVESREFRQYGREIIFAAVKEQCAVVSFEHDIPCRGKSTRILACGEIVLETIYKQRSTNKTRKNGTHNVRADYR